MQHKLFNKRGTNDPVKNQMRQRSWKERDAGIKQVQIMNAGNLDISELVSAWVKFKWTEAR